MKERLLFAGDSITDSGRLTIDDGLSLGNGYVRFIHDCFRRNGRDVEIINCGVKGYTTFNLKNHWQDFCINNNPDVVTILVGINELISMAYGGREILPKEYSDNLEWLIQETLGNTDAHIILMDTFLFRGYAELERLRSFVDTEIQIIRELAVKYETGYINLDGIFARFVNRYGTKKFPQDGVHLTRTGHKIIMQEWIKEYEYYKYNADNLLQ